MKKMTRIITVIIALMLTLSGCTPASTATNGAASAGQTTAGTASDTKAAAKDTVYPYNYKNPDGSEVKIEKEPVRLVSLSPTLTEVIYALGKGDLLKGRTDYCDYPAAVSSVASVGSMSEPSVEKILELDPDLVIVSFLQAETIAKIESAGARVIILPSGDSLEGSYANLLEMGRVLNAEDQADDLIAGIKTKIAAVQEKVKGETPVTAYYVAGFGQTGDYTAGDGTFINEVITSAGGINAAADVQGWNYTAEKLMEKDPEIIFMGSMANLAETFKVTEPYKNLTAVKDGRVYTVDDNLIAREGPRMGEAVTMLAKLFYPKAFQ